MDRTIHLTTRATVLEVAARVIASEGSVALSARRLAAEAETSTMAVYTYFGSMDAVRAAVRQEGFNQLTRRLDEVGVSNDPITDLARQGLAYTRWALEFPNLYRATFLEAPVGTDDTQAGIASFRPLVDVVKRCLDQRRLAPGEPLMIATKIWTALHGSLCAQLLGVLGFALGEPELSESAAMAYVADAARTSLLGLGAPPGPLDRSLAAAFGVEQEPT
jgi:AcrR family transcriptional regulator